MQGHWTHGQAYYRCKFRNDYPDGDLEHPKNVYVKKTPWSAASTHGSPNSSTTTTSTTPATRLAGVSEPDPDAEEREAGLRAAIADCDRKLANYRALLDHEDAVTVAASWIADTQRERKNLERQLGHQVPGDQLTPAQVKALVNALKDIVDVLADAEPADKAELYDQLGISLALRPRRNRHRQVASAWGNRTCRRGDLNPHAPKGTSPSICYRP